LQIDTWLNFIGEYDFIIFQRAVKVHYSESIWPPGAAEILRIIQRFEGEERRKLALTTAKREEIEYEKRLKITQIEAEELRARPDYEEQRAAFVEKYTKRFPLTDFIDNEPEAVDANILFRIQHGFYHFEHEERGLIEVEPRKFIAAPLKFLPKESTPFRRLSLPSPEEKKIETPEEAIKRKMEELKSEWKAIQVRKRSTESTKSIVEIVEEVAKEADQKFKLEVA